jgi:hypothetical protein
MLPQKNKPIRTTSLECQLIVSSWLCVGGYGLHTIDCEGQAAYEMRSHRRDAAGRDPRSLEGYRGITKRHPGMGFVIVTDQWLKIPRQH